VDDLNSIPRHLLEKYFGNDPRMVAAFENQSLAVQEATETSVAATGALQDASVVSLSPNDALNNEYILGPGDGTTLTLTAGAVSVDVDASVARASGGVVTLVAPASVTLFLPAGGELLSSTVPAKLTQPSMTGLANASSDANAAVAGVPVGGIYHNAGALRIRLV